MIYIGDHTVLFDKNGEPFVKNLMIFNLLSPLEGYEKIDIIPYDQFMLVQEGQEQMFDIAYANYIIQTGKISELMKFLLPFYEGKNIFILVWRDNGYRDMFVESILKFITHRYGVIPVEIYDVCDYDITPTQYNESFSIHGLYNFDQDKEVYIRDIVRGAVRNGIYDIPEGRLY